MKEIKAKEVSGIMTKSNLQHYGLYQIILSPFVPTL